MTIWVYWDCLGRERLGMKPANATDCDAAPCPILLDWIQIEGPPSSALATSAREGRQGWVGYLQGDSCPGDAMRCDARWLLSLSSACQTLRGSQGSSSKIFNPLLVYVFPCLPEDQGPPGVTPHRIVNQSRLDFTLPHFTIL